jgi:PAS domain S-box-containing protein
MPHEATRGDEVRRLQGCINDLISIQALPAIWSGQDSPHIVGTLLDVLVRVLSLDFACVRLNDPITGSPADFVRLAPRTDPPPQPKEISRALDRWLTNTSATTPLTMPNPAGVGEVRIAPFRLGLQDEIGGLVAGSKRADFPTQTDTLLLRATANQAVVALQEARYRDEHKRAALQLEQRVLERTEQLSAVKDELAVELTAMTRLHQFSTRLMANTELQPLLEEILDATMALQNADLGCIQLCCPPARELKFAAQRGLGRDFLDYFATIDDDAAACSRALHRGARVVVEDVLLDPAFEPHRAIAAACGFRAVQSTPLFSRKGETLGIISTHFRSPHRPLDRELRLTDLYARQAAEMIERKRAEEVLRSTEERFRRYFDLGLIGMAITSPAKDILEVNDELCRILGYERSELLQKTWADLTHPDDLAADVENFDRVVMGEMDGYTLDKRWLCKEGRVIDSIMTAQCVRHPDGSVDYFVGLVLDTTKRRRAEADLRRSEAFLAEGQWISHTGSWSVSFPSGDVFWSQETFRIYGLDPATTKITRENAFELIHPEDRAVVKQAFEQSVREESDYSGEHRTIMRDGSLKHLHALGHPVFDAAGAMTEFVGTVVDITQRKQAEAYLREANERTEAVLNSITDKFFAFDKDWRYTYFNKHAEEQVRFLGHDPAQLIGKTLWEKFPQPPAEEAFRRAMDQRVVVTHEHFYPPLGEWIENRIYPSADGGLAVYQRYVTDRKLAEEALQKTQAELTHVTRMTTIGELAASIAHEVNQPLGAIVNNASACLRLLDATGFPSDARAALSDIQADANRASAVIARIRALAKRSAPEKTSLRLLDVVADVLGLAQGELGAHRISVITEIPEDLPRVSGDRVQLQQVLLNLIKNGIEAMSGVEDGRRILTIRGQQDEIDGDPVLLVRLHDRGVGFKPADTHRLFEAFYTTKPQGMGMGLRISRSIVEAHGGRLWASPNAGPGATFFFALPTAVGSQLSTLSPPSPPGI